MRRDAGKVPDRYNSEAVVFSFVQSSGPQALAPSCWGPCPVGDTCKGRMGDQGDQDFPSGRNAVSDADTSGIADGASDFDIAAILKSSGEAAYEWRIEADTLAWSGNAAAVLGLRDTVPISTGRGFAMLLDPGNAKTRFDAVMQSTRRDQGAGVAYQVQYAIRSKPACAEAVDRGYPVAGLPARGWHAGACAWRHPHHQRPS